LFVIILDLDNVATEFLHPLIKNLPFIFSLFGFFLGVCLFYIVQFYKIEIINSKIYNFFYKLFCKMNIYFFFSGFFNFFYNFFFLNIFKFSYKINTKLIDKGFLELLGPFGLYKTFRLLSYFSLEYAPYIIFFSICFMFISICFIVLFFFLHVEMFVFLVVNRGLLFILIILFFFE
jgi:hypothetical protein